MRCVVMGALVPHERPGGGVDRDRRPVSREREAFTVQTEEQSRDVNAKLILLLANHVGDTEILREAMTIARRSHERTEE